MFPALEASSRTQIWSNFVARIPNEAHLTQDDLRELGAWDLNGRQIKNVLRMTLLTAQPQKRPITLQDLETMIGMTCPKAAKGGQASTDNVEKDRESDNLVDL